MPKQHSSGGKHKLGSISKQGDRYLRSLFTAAANRVAPITLNFFIYILLRTNSR